jgi:hypothetical protein
LRWRGVNNAGREITRETLDILRFIDDRLADHWGATTRRGRRSCQRRYVARYGTY